MSRLQIEHSTIYSYRQPVTLGRHRLVLRPREGHDVHVEQMNLHISPPHKIIWSRDVFSNSVAIVDFLEQTDRLEITSTVVVSRTIPSESTIDNLHRVYMPFEYEPNESIVTNSYLCSSFPDDRNELKPWLSQFTPSGDAEQLLMNICVWIKDRIKYQRRDVHGVQTPKQTLQLQSGSCRDMATLMMDGVRQLGLAARFASGYLDCPASQAGRSSTHAWVEVYLPIRGWCGFDPTLGEATSLKHIVVGVSQHPRGVMPISGVFSGPTGACTEMLAQVKIENLGQRVPAYT